MEKLIIAGGASIMALRMLGLFMLLPVLASYTTNLHAAPITIGIAIGIYGLMQAMLQIPFGMLSDRFGRKQLILIGLLLLIIGSIIGIFANNIIWIIIARSVQGAGAIGCVVLALVADNTRVELVPRAMAIIGISIGAAFTLAFILGPLVAAWLGISGIFFITAILASIALVIVIFLPIKNTRNTGFVGSPDVSKISKIIFGATALHASLAAMFLIIPNIFTGLGFAREELWQCYLPIMLLSMLVTAIFIRFTENGGALHKLFIGSIIGLLFSEVLLYNYSNNLVLACMCVIGFFTAFNLLEAHLPMQVSKHAPSGKRGLVLGMYSSMQFLGVFLGGVIGGYLQQYFGVMAVVVFCVILGSLWLVLYLPRFNKGEVTWQEA